MVHNTEDTDEAVAEKLMSQKWSSEPEDILKVASHPAGITAVGPTFHFSSPLEYKFCICVVFEIEY